MRAVHPLDDVGLTVLLVDHGRIVLADDLVFVQLLDGVQVGQCGLDSLVRCGLDDQLFCLSHGISPVGLSDGMRPTLACRHQHPLVPEPRPP